LRIGTWLGDIHTQYHQVRPWLLLGEGSTYTSSAMPQKRNPGLLMRARERASNVVGLAQTVALRAHNVSTGMTDTKESVAELGTLAQAVRMVEAMNAVLDALSINPARALEELEDEWTTSMELAEALAQEHQIPFRVGHRFASEIVTVARDQGLKPKNFPYEKAQELYAKAIAHFKLPDPKLPLSQTRFREVLSPAFMVKTRVGVGGPQPAEVSRMLKNAQAQLSDDRAWLDQRRQNLRAADARLDEAFSKLLNGL
jgi:argininosuccinate lyase